jgi:N-acetylmuramic acid 6-phosphate etherase
MDGQKLFLVSILFFSNTSLLTTDGLYLDNSRKENLSVTEHMNNLSENLDLLSSFEIVSLMNQEDRKLADAVQQYLSEIASVVEAAVNSLKSGGRLIYLGAGSSGRIGVLDASECPPTFSAQEGQVVGLIAGGDFALRHAIENIEDHAEFGVRDLKNIELTSRDVVCGISCSGCAAYVSGALAYAREVGCFTAFITCNPKNKGKILVDAFIAPEVGPEVLTGSTRLKAGTATKMILNMITTASFVRLGKVFGNLMVDLKPLNKKLVARSKRILCTIFDIDEGQAEQLIEQSGKSLKIAILMQMSNIDRQTAEKALQKSDGYVRKAIELLRLG